MADTKLLNKGAALVSAGDLSGTVTTNSFTHAPGLKHLSFDILFTRSAATALQFTIQPLSVDDSTRLDTYVYDAANSALMTAVPLAISASANFQIIFAGVPPGDYKLKITSTSGDASDVVTVYGKSF